MPDEITPAGTGAPAAGQPPAPPVPQVPAAPAAPAVDQNPPWLAGRLQEARERLLKELGAADLDAAKNAIKAAQAAAEADKTAQQKLGEATRTIETEKARAERYEGIIKERAAAELANLKPEQQAAVRAIAPDADPAAQLRAITALTPTWAAAGAPAPAAPSTPAAPPPATPPTGTAPPRDAPPGTNGASPPDHKAIHAELAKTNPILAARYADQHSAQIYKS